LIDFEWTPIDNFAMIRRRMHSGSRIKVRKAAPDEILGVLAKEPGYVGNPVHKRYPEDYNLKPPACPRQDKTLCDLEPRDPIKSTRRLPKTAALRLFKDGVRRGLYSDTSENGFPRRIWAVDGEGIVFEAKLDNPDQGTYHGYPLASKQRNLIDRISCLWENDD
jgi:hypothetical protein